jgi:hypothetical protein
MYNLLLALARRGRLRWSPVRRLDRGSCRPSSCSSSYFFLPAQRR